MTKKLILPIKGTRDFYPEDMAIRNWLYQKMREVSESFGYQEYDGPFLESLDLYAAKSGDELVKEQSFVFPDRGGDLITLRPELTPSLTRMVAQRQKQLAFPLRWWSFGPFWRYERPQKGRSREFFQWNVDLIGVGTPEADAEIAAVIATFFKKVGLSSNEVVVLVNNRRLMESELLSIGIPQQIHPQIFKLIDRREKMKPSEWEAYASEIGLNNEQRNRLNDLLQNQDLWMKSEELSRFFACLEALGAREYVKFAPHIIRGLDYYTGTVFEAHSLTGDVQRAILGGGRYDNLMADVGGDPLPGVGFAMGDVVITLLLRQTGHLPTDISKIPAPVMITVFDQEHILSSFALASELRKHNLNILCYPTPNKLTKQFKYADRIGVRLVIVNGPEEIEKGSVTIKDLRSGEQITIPRQKLPEKIHQWLAQQPST